MKIGIFGGSFNPIHWGHIHLAIALLEAKKLNEIWFIPNHISPFKKEVEVEGKSRLQMVKKAIQGIPGFKVLDIEVKKRGKSYTIDTVRTLKEKYPHYQFFLILGDDLLKDFHQWKEVDELVKLAPPLVGSRNGIVQKGVVPIPRVEISATEIRKRLKKKKFCGHLLPAKVLDYIKRHRLYS